jgi:hypothetical protein
MSDKPHSMAVPANGATSAMAHEAVLALAKRASDAARPLAELSHMAALAAERLATGETLSQVDRDAVASMLREMRIIGHQAFIKRSGSEADYQDIGAAITKQFRGRGGAWRA